MVRITTVTLAARSSQETLLEIEKHFEPGR
jgi:hypothetical protein